MHKCIYKSLLGPSCISVSCKGDIYGVNVITTKQRGVSMWS